MKKIAFGMACGFTVLFVLLMMLTLYGRSTRQKEAKIALSQAIDTALSGAMDESHPVSGENSNFTADFLKALLTQTNSDSDLTVSILDADDELGIMSVEITEKFKHPNGKEGTVSDVRTVIFDRAVEEAEAFQTVSFYVDEEIYKTYTVRKNAVCTMPRPPKKEGKKFLCWRFVTGGIGEAGSVSVSGENGKKQVLASGGVPCAVSEDIRLIAVFE